MFSFLTRSRVGCDMRKRYVLIRLIIVWIVWQEVASLVIGRSIRIDTGALTCLLYITSLPTHSYRLPNPPYESLSKGLVISLTTRPTLEVSEKGIACLQAEKLERP